MREKLRLRRNSARDLLHVAGDVGKLDPETTDPIAELIDQTFALRSLGERFSYCRLCGGKPQRLGSRTS
jgi:hypothetical protein